MKVAVMNMKYQIIPFAGQQTKEIIDFICEIQRIEFGIAIGPEEQPDLQQIFQAYQKAGGNFWLALTEDNEIIGTIALLKLDDNKGTLKKMFVAKKYRELKIGVALLNELLDYAKEINLSAIYLGTNEKFVAAQHFYKNNGFIEIDKTSLPENFPALDVDNRFYVKHL